MKVLARASLLTMLLTLPFVAGAQNINAILADPSRPQEDRDSDAGRAPAQILEFFGVGPGDHVADLLAGGGYFTRILVPLVGSAGRVYAGNNPFYAGFFGEAFDALLAQPRFANVVRIDGRVDALPLPRDASLDVVIISNAYHDLVLGDEDRNEMNRIVFAALKPGGVYGIIDHAAAPGSGTSATEALHRIDKQTVINEIQAAGFELAAEASFLRNTSDDHSAAIFDPSARGRTDRFVLRFEKP